MTYLGYMFMGLICVSAITSSPTPRNTETDDKVFEKLSPRDSLTLLREEIEIPKRSKREEKGLPKYWRLASEFNALEKELNNTKSGKRRIHLKTDLKSLKQSSDIIKNKNKLNLPKEPKLSIVNNERNIPKNESVIANQKKHHRENNDFLEEFVIPKELIDELEKQLDLPTQSTNNNEFQQDLVFMEQSTSSETNFLSEDVSKTIDELDENDSNKNNSIDVRSTVFMHKSKYRHPTIGQGFCLKKGDFQQAASSYGEPPENPSLHKNFLKQLLFSSENNKISLEDPYKPSQRENSSNYLDLDKTEIIQPHRTTSTSHQRDDSSKFDYDERFKLLQLFKSPLIRQKSLNKGPTESRCLDHQAERKSPGSVIDPRLSLPSSYYFPIIPNEIERMSVNMPIPASTRQSILDDIQRPAVTRKENILRKYGDHDYSPLYTTKSNNAELKKQPSDVYCLFYVCKLKKITPGQGNGDSVEMDCKCKNDNDIDDDHDNSKWYKNVGVVKGRIPTPMFRTKLTQRKREPTIIDSFVI